MKENLIRAIPVYLRELGTAEIFYAFQAFRAISSGYRREGIPSTAAIELTYDCNRKCKGCYVQQASKTKKGFIDPAIFHRAVTQLEDYGIRVISLSGGEPLQPQWIDTIYSMVSPHRSVFAIATNGDYIAKNGLSLLGRLPHIIYALSIDGFEACNDRIRGKDSFANVVSSFRQLREHRKFYCANITIRPENIGEVTDRSFLEFLAAEGVKLVNIMKLKTEDQDNLPNAEFDRVISLIKGFCSKYPFFVTFGGNDRGYTESEDFRYSTFYVDPDGRVRLVKPLKNYVGDLKKEDLSAIVTRVFG